MKCFYHPQSDAVGVCKNCQKGTCSECAVDIAGDGLACKGRCEAQVEILNSLMVRSASGIQATGKMYKVYAVFFGVVGFICLSIGLLSAIAVSSPIGYVAIVLGLVFLVLGWYNLSAGRKFTRKQSGLT